MDPIAHAPFVRIYALLSASQAACPSARVAPVAYADPGFRQAAFGYPYFKRHGPDATPGLGDQ